MQVPFVSCITGLVILGIILAKVLVTTVPQKTVIFAVDDIGGSNLNPAGVSSTLEEGAFVRRKNSLVFLGQMEGKIA